MVEPSLSAEGQWELNVHNQWTSYQEGERQTCKYSCRDIIIKIVFNNKTIISHHKVGYIFFLARSPYAKRKNINGITMICCITHRGSHHNKISAVSLHISLYSLSAPESAEWVGGPEPDIRSFTDYTWKLSSLLTKM